MSCLRSAVLEPGEDDVGVYISRRLKDEQQAMKAKMYLDAIGGGATHRVAMDYAGLTNRTYDAIARESKEVGYLLATARSEAILEMSAILVQKARDGDWRAAERLLEALAPEEYGKQASLRVKHSVDPLQEMSDEEIEAVLKDGGIDPETLPGVFEG